MNAKPRARWGDGRIAVAAKWPLIRSALAAKWPLTRIYAEHIDPDLISYSQFRRQVQRQQKAEPAVTPPTTTQEPTSGRERNNPDRTAFDFDPKPPPNQWKRPRGS
jgi:hypothetical protein